MFQFYLAECEKLIIEDNALYKQNIDEFHHNYGNILQNDLCREIAHD